METSTSLMSGASSHYASAFDQALETEQLHRFSPAVFAVAAHESTGSSYKFVSTERVLGALAQAGFLPVAARQTQSRTRSPLHARHVIRLRRRFETVSVHDCVPEILFLNSHDGTSAYQLRVGLFRAVCANGLLVAMGGLPVWRVLHRGDHVEGVVRAALEVSERFTELGHLVENMRRTEMYRDEQLQFAHSAMLLRFPEAPHGGLEASQLLVPRRPEDIGNDLWHTLNVIQENVIRGGLSGRTATGRARRTRGITAIREDIRLNTGLWELAARYVA